MFLLTKNKGEKDTIELYVSIILSIVCITILSIADSTSLFSYFYALLLLIVSSLFISRDNFTRVLFSYHVLLLFAILFFFVQKSQNPIYQGLSGHTDDGFYYYQLTGGRGIQYYVRLYFVDKHPFSSFLSALYPFTIYTPLNIVCVNLIFGAYLPITVGNLALLLTQNEDIKKTSFWLILFCPFTLYYSCIIMRESLMALMVCAGLCFFIKRK